MGSNLNSAWRPGENLHKLNSGSLPNSNSFHEHLDCYTDTHRRVSVVTHFHTQSHVCVGLFLDLDVKYDILNALKRIKVHFKFGLCQRCFFNVHTQPMAISFIFARKNC